jgi:hypothetical protein
MPDDLPRPAPTNLYRTVSLAVLMLAAAFEGSPAKANDAAELNLARLHLLPSEAIQVGETKTARSGDAVLTGQFAYESSARLRWSATIKLLGLTIPIDKSPLLEARGTAYPGRVYCSGLFEVPKEAQQVAGGSKFDKRFEREVRVCLLDQDGDKSFDASFIHGAKFAADRNVVPMAPLAYTNDQQMIGAFRLKLQKSDTFSVPVLSTEAAMFRPSFEQSTVWIIVPPKKHKSFDSNRRISGKSYPVTFAYGDASVTVLGYDSETETMTYRIDRNLVERQAGVQWIASSGYLGYTMVTYE